jgi:hypothetical protein
MAEINKFSKEYIGEDSVIDILLRMDYHDLLNMCKTSKEFNSICKRDSFWIMKGKYDFGETYSNNYKRYNLSPKEIYNVLYKHIDLYKGFDKIPLNDFDFTLKLPEFKMASINRPKFIRGNILGKQEMKMVRTKLESLSPNKMKSDSP